MALLIDNPEDDPAVARLSGEAWSAWLDAIGYCAFVRSDIVGISSLTTTDEVIDEWERAGLAARVPIANLRVLGRGRLWDYAP